MNPSYKQLFSTPVQFRIMEKRTKTLEGFAASICDSKIISVACDPKPWADRKRCFVNVEKKIKSEGGRMITGWMFNEHNERSIEGEAHAIWQDRYGKKKLDITPHDYQPKRILFLPDPKVAVKRGYTAHPRIVLSDDPRVIAVEAFDEEMQKIRERAFNGFETEMIISKGDYEAARDKSGLPDDVAQHLFELSFAADQEAYSTYGGL